VTITFSEAERFHQRRPDDRQRHAEHRQQQRWRHHLDGHLHADQRDHRHQQPDHPGQQRRAEPSGNAGSGTTDSNNYAIDTQRPTATIVVANGPGRRPDHHGDHHLQRGGPVSPTPT
jgi:hypothetical protein